VKPGALGDAVDQELIRTWSTHSGVEQAALLNRSYPFGKWRRGRLLKAGLVSLETRKANRPWTEAERHTVETLASERVKLPAIAARIGRRSKKPGASVQCFLIRQGKPATALAHKNPLRPLTASELAELMGRNSFRRRTLHALIDAGVLTVRHRVRKERKWQPILIDMTTFADFLANRRYWMVWDADAITDPDWRDEALRLRREADGHWIAMADWCRAHHYSPITSWFWIHDGLLPSAVQWGRRWYVWSRELETFIPPCERGRTD
jgi:hypothetical protein